ncbi:MAG: T9SS type A sorting domain-containing protein [Bacteroidota bacterium]|nr:T9SS type A sorting domain-containing protein [Bacteroidota bacterium]
MKRIIAISVLFISFSILLHAQPNTGNFSIQFNNSGTTSVISFYVPSNYDSTKSYPMIYGWHGAGMAGSSMRDMLYIVLAQKHNAIVSCPDANNLNGKPIQLLNTLIERSYNYTMNTYNIDTNKIVITGFSWGGKMAYQLGLSEPNKYNGIIGLAPAISSFSGDMWSNIKNIRMATILGDKDFNYTPVNALMTDISKNGGEILYKIKAGVQHVDNAYFNSQEFIDDYEECYQYVLNIPIEIEENEVFDNENIKIYPNPAKDYIIINNIKNTTFETIEIFDITAKLIKSYSNNSLRINISDLKKGLYFLKISTNKSIFVKKIIIE